MRHGDHRPSIPFPKFTILRLPQTPCSNHALSVHPNPIGCGMATEAIVEAATPDCIVPGQTVPIKLLGLKVWPVEVDLNFLKPVGRELKLLEKIMDNAVNLMNKSFIDRYRVICVFSPIIIK